MRRRSMTAALVALAVLIPAGVADAHVTLQPREVPAGGFKRLDVRVPNERDKADTTKVVVQFPEGFTTVGYEPVDGWKATVKMAKLAQPIEVEGERVTERLSTVTFTAEKGVGIGPGEFRDFGLSLRMPEKPGALVFKALQTYDNGEVVRWIGPEDADEPAPRVELTAPEGEGGAGHAGQGAAQPAAADADEADDEEDDDDDGNGLAVVALIVGGLGLIAGVAGLMAARRTRPSA